MSTNKKITKTEDKDILENKSIAVLSYLWILCLIPLLTKKDSKFVQFHAKQGLVLLIIEIAGTLIYWFPILGQLFALLLLIVSITGVIKTLNGESWKIPYIYDLSKKINI